MDISSQRNHGSNCDVPFDDISQLWINEDLPIGSMYSSEEIWHLRNLILGELFTQWSQGCWTMKEAAAFAWSEPYYYHVECQTPIFYIEQNSCCLSETRHSTSLVLMRNTSPLDSTLFFSSCVSSIGVSRGYGAQLCAEALFSYVLETRELVASTRWLVPSTCRGITLHSAKQCQTDAKQRYPLAWKYWMVVSLIHQQIREQW